ncbi:MULTISPECIES: P-loop NTPase fold protein [unclassified Nostoc]|uniref:P-loop NTPase fold protein n=1 Tax=unclassified Nostoc TaxID=2593658 RepID=UPI002AD59E30|nr:MULTISPECIES: P-loop NTPase fold protein [unclassified Nostoc]MDZ8036124.1 AAA family ATPase [Nostoc sp. DedSLP04]MDZ8128180.1 AAA family ATPase [Nostoc sp. DedQUE07]
MKLDLVRFFQACNPSKTLVVSKPEDRQYYIDFSKVRGAKIIEELGRTITRLSPEEPTCQLFTGHIGCGKSTELLRLKAELEQQGFHVVYFESSQSLDMADIDVTDILLAVAREVSQSLEAIKINLKPGYFQTLFTELGEFLQTPIELGGELSVGIAKITAKTKDSPKLRAQLRQYLEPRTNGILESINKELLKPAREKLKQQGKKGLVVIIDNLDRVDNSLKPSGYYQPEYLFVERGEQLNQLNCHVVYTIPLVLIFSNALGRLTNRFGVDPKVLPMVPVQLQDGLQFSQGITLLQQMVMARAFPGVSWEQSQHLITEVFDNSDTLERLCRVSGGHLRNLLMLLFRCLQQEDPPLSRECVDRVIKQRRNELTLAITPDEWEVLREVAQKKSLRGHERYELLLRSMFVFEYRNEDGSWFDVNPILAEAKEFRL